MFQLDYSVRHERMVRSADSCTKRNRRKTNTERKRVGEKKLKPKSLRIVATSDRISSVLWMDIFVANCLDGWIVWTKLLISN